MNFITMRRLLLSVLMVLMAGATLSAQRAQAPQRGVWSDEDGLPPLYGDVDSVVVTTFTLKDVFGEITKGLEVVDKIQNVATDANDRPLEDVRILSVKVIE